MNELPLPTLPNRHRFPELPPDLIYIGTRDDNRIPNLPPGMEYQLFAYSTTSAYSTSWKSPAGGNYAGWHYAVRRDSDLARMLDLKELSDQGGLRPAPHEF